MVIVPFTHSVAMLLPGWIAPGFCTCLLNNSAPHSSSHPGSLSFIRLSVYLRLVC